jgi:adenine-specific DNA-methyltransferase
MKLSLIPIKKALNKAYLKEKVLRSEIENFKTHLINLLERIDVEESEENVKGHLSTFLDDTYYKNKHLIATKGRTDLVIHTEKKAKSPVGILFEVKRPKNQADMISPSNPNTKAFHELLLYYFQERLLHKNTDIKYCIITNVYDWYIFDAAVFDKYFYQNKQLRKDFQLWNEGRKTQNTTDFFYKEIALPFISQTDIELACTHFSIKDFERPLKNKDFKDDKKLVPLFKVFSPVHLLKIPFANDSNTLDKQFYHELLHLIGLEETKEKGKKIIQRKAPNKRQAGSLLENTIATLQTEDRLHRIKNLEDYGTSKEERLFNVALELCIIWINRILFLKLLEAQLLKYHKNDASYKFLSSAFIADYDELNELFFEILAKNTVDRPDYIKAKFERIPYLNSSLFEIHDLEDVTIRINSLKDRFQISPIPNTVLKDPKGKRILTPMKTLEYLFQFLEAYDFSSEGAEEIQEENKTLINASVLGLIFEKINGYKDGSFYTPGFVTMYMCKHSIRRACIKQFKETYADFDSDQFDDLKNFLSSKYKKEDLNTANQVINNLKICDPAVGSGHFLVSALNELISIKSELNILCDKEGNRLPIRVEIENDELIVTHRHSDEFFEYQPGIRESQLIQEALFHEKQQLIENCLFGVDINPNSVKICRLRLWIELLKNAYYKKGAHSNELETLPNIDINIKQGNSLISRFSLIADLKKALKSIKYDINAYKGFVRDYQHATDKDTKRGLLSIINQIKKDFRTEIGRNDPKIRRLQRLSNEYFEKYQTEQLFAQNLSAAQKKDKKKLESKIEKLNNQIEEIKNSAIYHDAFEWRFEFPEVLNEEGAFVGFDVIIGNPPYIRQEAFSSLKPFLQENYDTYAGTADLLVYFIEKGIKLLKPQGQFTFIISNKFMRANFGQNIRQWLTQWRLTEILDFGDLPVFEEATTYPCILSVEKSAAQTHFTAANVPELDTLNFEESVKEHSFSSLQDSLSKKGWTLTDVKTQKLLAKLKTTGQPLGEYVNGKIFRGVLTGLNTAFVIDEATKDQLIQEDPKSAEIIKPFLAGRDIKRYEQPMATKYLIFARRGIDVYAYPAILKHLSQYKEQLEPRPKDWPQNKKWPGRKPGSYKWYEIQDAVDYYEEFEKPKIMYAEIAIKGQFTIDKNKLYGDTTAYIIPIESFELLGILNSKVFTFYFSSISSEIRGGFYRWKRQYMENIPLPNEFQGNKEIAMLAKKLWAGEMTVDKDAFIQLNSKLDRIVYELYGLTEEEIEIIEESLGNDN